MSLTIEETQNLLNTHSKLVKNLIKANYKLQVSIAYFILPAHNEVMQLTVKAEFKVSHMESYRLVATTLPYKHFTKDIHTIFNEITEFAKQLRKELNNERH